MPTSGAVQIVLQRHRRAHGLGDSLYCLFCLLCPPQIGVQHRARQVNDRTQRALRMLAQPPFSFLRPRHAPAGYRILSLNMATRVVLKLA